MKFIQPIDVEMIDEDFEQVEEATGNVDQKGTTGDFEKYKSAMLDGDVDTLESLRLKHPEDARFNTHLEVIQYQADNQQSFAEAKKEHEKMLREMNLDGVPQFRKLLDSGNKQKTIEYIKTSIRKDHPLRNSMIRLTDFM
jgi:hypothetical protein